MRVYAGIDEAGYGPMFGPLTIGRVVMSIPDDVDPTKLWDVLSKAVCHKPSDRAGRIAINDSKKLHSKSAGLKHLELGVLSFAELAGIAPTDTGGWLGRVTGDSVSQCDAAPWYRPTEDHPWAALPCANTPEQIAIAHNLLHTHAARQGVGVQAIDAAAVLESRFNQMVAATRSKASTCFTFIARHLRATWDDFGHLEPLMVVDRQSGRVRYRELLSMTFPESSLRVLEESAADSAYLLESPGPPARCMTVRFEVQADGNHLPVALASMVSKYTRELLMNRFKAWFSSRAPHVKPTAGYASDAKRFWREIEPLLPELSIKPHELCRSR